MKIPQINVVIEFELVENLILLIGGVLKDFQKNNNAQVQFLNVPQNIPPNAPRILVSVPNALVNISLTRFEIICNVPEHITSNFNSALSFTKDVVNKILKQLWVSELLYNWVGLVSTIDFPLNKTDKSALEIAVPYYDKLININRKERDLATFEIKFGFKEGVYFKNYTLSCFETRDFKIESIKQPDWRKLLNIDEISAINNIGLRIILDVNNKAGDRSGDFNLDLSQLIDNYVTYIENIPNELNIKELI